MKVEVIEKVDKSVVTMKSNDFYEGQINCRFVKFATVVLHVNWSQQFVAEKLEEPAPGLA